MKELIVAHWTLEPLSQDAIAGKYIYIANGCVGCHTQQVRNVDMDKMWAKAWAWLLTTALIRRTDFWRNTATLMGTGRTGPDLTNVGTRQGNKGWNLTHLFNPRILSGRNQMPALPLAFEIKEPDRLSDGGKCTQNI